MSEPYSRTDLRSTVEAIQESSLSSDQVRKIVVAALENREHLEPEDIALCTALLMEKLRMPPLHDTIYRSKSGRLIIRDREVKDSETEKMITESARIAQRNVARKLVREQVEYLAALMSRKATSLWDIVFSNAALWAIQQEEEVYAALTSEPEDLSPALQDE